MTPDEFWEANFKLFRANMHRRAGADIAGDCMVELYLIYRGATKNGIRDEVAMKSFVMDRLTTWAIVTTIRKLQRVRKFEVVSLDYHLEMIDGSGAYHDVHGIDKHLAVAPQTDDLFDILEWMEVNTPELYERMVKRASAKDMAEAHNTTEMAIKARLLRQRLALYRRYGILLQGKRKRPSGYRRTYPKPEDSSR